MLSALGQGGGGGGGDGGGGVPVTRLGRHLAAGLLCHHHDDVVATLTP